MNKDECIRVIPVAACISSVRRRAPLRMLDTNRLNPGNNRRVRNVPVRCRATADSRRCASSMLNTINDRKRRTRKLEIDGKYSWTGGRVIDETRRRNHSLRHCAAGKFTSQTAHGKCDRATSNYEQIQVLSNNLVAR